MNKYQTSSDQSLNICQYYAYYLFSCALYITDQANSVKIVGGQESAPHSIPWQVALGQKDDVFCGGTLITSQHVLTAAHCTHKPNTYIPFNARSLFVIVGAHKIASPIDGIRHTICQYSNHPSYNPRTFDNDFSLFHLNQPVKIGSRVSPVNLPPPNFGGNFLDNRILRVSGWGRTLDNEDAPGSAVLLQINVPGISNSKCNQPNFYGNRITGNMLCAGYDSGGIDACAGDSGGKKNDLIHIY